MCQNLYDISLACLFHYLDYNIRKVSHTFSTFLPFLFYCPCHPLNSTKLLSVRSSVVSMILYPYFLLPTSPNLPQHLTQCTTFSIQSNIFSLASCDPIPSGLFFLGTYFCHQIPNTTLNYRNFSVLCPGPHPIVLERCLLSHGFNYHLGADDSQSYVCSSVLSCELTKFTYRHLHFDI